MEKGVPSGNFEGVESPQNNTNVSIFLGENVSTATVHLLRRTLEVVSTASRVMGDEFTLQYSQDRKRAINNSDPSSLHFLKRHGLHLPQFAVFDQQTSAGFFALTPFPEESIEPGNLLLVFQHSPLIARQNGRIYEEAKQNCSSVDWKEFDSPIKKLIRKKLKHAQHKDGLLTIRKINDYGEHDSNLFHYVWEIGIPDTSYLASHHNRTILS